MGTGSGKQDVIEDVLDVVVLVDLRDLFDEDERSLARGANAQPNDNLGRMEGSIKGPLPRVSFSMPKDGQWVPKLKSERKFFLEFLSQRYNRFWGCLRDQ